MAAVIWLVGFGVVAAFAHSMTSAPVVGTTEVTAARVATASWGEPARSEPRDEPRVTVKPPAHAILPPHATHKLVLRSPAAAERHCSEWRALQQGSSYVQVCE